MRLSSWAIVVAVVLTGLGVGVQPACATGLGMQPLQYRITLKQGERQKGFVDITNPSAATVAVTTSVQGFRQLDDNGTLQFFNSTAVREGVLLDLKSFDLGPRETIRLFFVVDGTKLPSGDVFAALFATIQPVESPGVSSATPTVRVGTILSIVNGTPGSRHAEVTDLSVGFFQFTPTISGTYTIKNTADPTKTTGFYPAVKIGVAPLKKQATSTSRLVYAGNSRITPFELHTARFGLYQVTASFDGSQKSKWVFIVSGVWRWAAIGAMGALLIGGVWWGYRRLHHKRRRVSR